MMTRYRRLGPLMAVAALVAVAPAVGQGVYWNEISTLFFSPDGKTLYAACLDDKMHIYDVATGKERAVINAHKEGVWSAALSPDGKLLATGGGDKVIRLWEAETFKELRSFEGHTKEVMALAFSPDGKTLASGGGDHTIRTWDVGTAKEKKIWHGHELMVLSVAFSPDGKRLASGGVCTAAVPGFAKGATHADQVKIWDVETGKEIHQSAQRGTTVAFSPDGRMLLAAGSYVLGTPIDGGATIVSRMSKVTLGPVQKDAAWIDIKGIGSAAALSADGRLLAVAYGTRLHVQLGKFFRGNEADFEHWKTTLWDTATGKEIMQFADDGATAVAISPDGKKVASGSTTGEVKFWDATPEQWPYAEKAPQLDQKALDNLWADLADEAVGPSYTAIWTLAAAGKPAVAFLKAKLAPQKPAAGAQVKDLLTKLDSDKYAVREAAFRDLKNLGSVIEADVRGTVTDDKTSQEVRKRLQKLLESWEKRPGSPEEIQQARAIHVLERIGTAEAKAVLMNLADERAGAWLTEEARLAVKRVEMR